MILNQEIVKTVATSFKTLSFVKFMSFFSWDSGVKYYAFALLFLCDSFNFVQYLSPISLSAFIFVGDNS